MKTSNFYVAVMFTVLLLPQAVNAQDTHEQVELLFVNNSLATFETHLTLTNEDYGNQPLIDYVDDRYQWFHTSIEERLENGEQIDAIQFNAEYYALVSTTQAELQQYKDTPAPPGWTPKAPNGPCVNMDFETGDLTGWDLTRGNVNGAAPYSFVGEFPVGPGPYHQIFGGGVDPVTGIPRVDPLGGNFSVRLGNGTGVGARAARMRQTFMVDATNYMFTYSYAVVFQSPAGHSLNQLPYFTVRVFDSTGANVPCGEYSVIADAANAPDYQQIWWGGSIVLYKNWETVFTNLSAYIGQNVTIEFTSGDCSLTGHFGYAYVDASCGMQDIIASSNTICNGDSTLLTAPPGASSYLWNTGATTQSIWVQSGGTYSCELIPFQGGACSITLDITITEFPSPTADFVSNVTEACLGEPVTFTDQSTIPPPGTISAYRWDFDNGIITPESSGAISGVPNTSGTYTNPTHTFAAPGTYNVELWVTTPDGCSDSLSLPITIHDLPTVVAGPDQFVCEGESVTLSGSGAVSYSWTGGVVDGVPFVPGLGTTPYTVTGTDANGCQNTDLVNVTVWPLPVVDAGPDQFVCDGDIVTLAGSGAATYAWDQGVTNGVPFIPAVGTLTYTVIGTDGNGCQNTDQVDVTVHALPTIGAGPDQFVCDGTPVTLSGSGGVSYTWSGGITNGVPFTQAVGTQSYTVTGTDANGCQNTDNVDVTVYPLPTVNGGPDQFACEGESITLSGSGAVSYSWTGGVVDGVPFVPALGTTTYIVTGTDANGCQNTDLVNVTVWPLPIVDAGTDQFVCDGDIVTLTGSGAATYAWDQGVTNGVPFIPAVGTLTYTVIGTDANGCQNTDQVDVTVHALPTIGAGPDQFVCDGTPVTLSGSGGVSYTWSGGITNGVPFTQAVGTQTYTVTGTDANGCQNTDDVDVTVYPLPTVNGGPDQFACEGESITLSGSGAVSYSWTGGVVDGVPFIPALGTTTYIVTGTDANGCQNTDLVNVTVWPLPIVDAGTDQFVCDGDIVMLTGSGAATYAWDQGVTNGVPFIPAVGTLTYTVIGTDANGCQNTDQVDVTVHALPTIGAGPDQFVCDGTPVTLSGSGGVSYTWSGGITNGVPFTQAVGTQTYTVTGTDANGCQNTDNVDVTVYALPNVNAGPDQFACDGGLVTLSGSGAVSYSWDQGVVDGVPFTPAVGTTTYTVIGTDANGCQNSDNVDVTVHSLPTVNAGPDQEVCDGDMVTLSGSGAVSYVWDQGVTDGMPFMPAVGTLTYTMIGTDANGCSNSDQVDVTVHALPNVNAGPDQTVCDGVQVTLTASGAPSLTWDQGVQDGVPFLPSLGTTTYTVTGTDLHGCMNTDQANVTVNPLPNVNAGPDQEVCDGTEVTLVASGASTYSWSGGVVNGVPFTPNMGTHIYTVTGTDANNCSNNDDVVVIVNPNPVVDAGADQTGCQGDSIVLTAQGTQNLYWSHGVIDGVPFVQPVGVVTYTVYDSLATGCTSFDTVRVVIHPNPIVTTENKEICEGEGVTLWGQGADTYTWSGGVINGVEFFPTESADYFVVGTDLNGCTDDAVAKVIVHPAPFVDFTILDPVLTTSNSTTGFDNLSVGATSYIWDFGDQSPFSYEFEPTHTFPYDEAGSYVVTLTGISDQGCRAEAVHYLEVEQDYLIYVPNAFTPDANGVNEIFKPILDGFDESKYTLYIFNRWGQIVFESHDMEVGWDGTFGASSTEAVQDGVYTWKIEAGLEGSAEMKVFVGHVSVLK